MNIHRTLITGSLPVTATLAILGVLSGCNSDREKDQLPEPVSNRAAVHSPAGDVRRDAADSSTSYSSPLTDGDQSVSGLSGEAADNAEYSMVDSAIAQIKPTSARAAEGSVAFSPGEDVRGMRVSVELRGLDPGPYGLHVHEIGDCSADDASSAGGRFNPYDTEEGLPEAAGRQAGDRGNFEADAEGRVSTELNFRGLAFSGPASILQKAVVIHRNANEASRQGADDASDRVGCGVIQSAGQAKSR